jgi:hypothetical protein
MTAYVEACGEHLLRPEGRPVLHWLTEERAIPADVLLAEGIGADPGRARLPRSDGLPRGSPAAVFPVLADGDVVFLQSRLLRPGDRRWLNPRSSFAPNPRLAVLGGAAADHGSVVVTEGMIDGLSVVAGGQRAVALLGAATVNSETLARIARCASSVVIATDNDDAGRHARDSLHVGLNHLGVPVSDLVIPERFKDLNDWHREARAHWARTLRSQEQQAAALAQVDDGIGEVGVPLPVGAHAVAVAQTTDPRDLGGVDQVIDVDQTAHADSLVAMRQQHG